MWWLFACACPSFDETHVVDSSPLAGGSMLDLATNAVRSFADWTGREGVCVAEVEVVDAIVNPNDPFASREAGVFEGPPPHIQVVADTWPVEQTVTHELCHALDHHERISATHKDLFPGDALPVPDAYPSEVEKHAEDFAQACEDGPDDDAFQEAFGDQCGGFTRTDVARFLRDEVYPDAPRADVRDTPVDLTLRRFSTPMDGWPIASEMDGLVGDGDALLALIRTHSSRNRHHYALSLLWIDPDTGAVLDRVDVDLPAAHWSAALVPGDDGPLLIAWNGDRPDALGRTFTIVDHALVPRALQVPSPWGGAGAVIDGMLVWASSEERAVSGRPVLFGKVRAADLDTGAERELSFPPEEWGLSVWAHAFLLGPDGLEMSTDDGLARLDPSDGTWTRTYTPPDLYGLLRVGDRRVAAWYDDGFIRPAVFDPDAETWALPADACSAYDHGPFGFTGLGAQLGDRAFQLANGWAEDGAWTFYELGLGD